MTHSWIYSNNRMVLREQCLSTLLKEFGTELKPNGEPQNSTKSIYECAHDWVSQGSPTANGIITHYKLHYQG